MLNETTLPRHTTLRELIAAMLLSASRHVSGNIVKDPTLTEIKERQLYDAEIALLNAEAEEERHRFTVGMLRERVKRLRQ